MPATETHPSTPEQDLADLWLTLGRAYLPPMEPEHWRALRADLPLDLLDWARVLELDSLHDAENLLAAMAAYNEHEDLLRHYSGLFYAPPVRVPLNLGLYLDARANGPALDALARWHAAYGLDRAPAFHDLTDHLTAVLEFLSVITRQGEHRLAREFAHVFLLPALPRVIARMELNEASDSPYQRLLRFTLAALERAYPPEEQSADIPARPHYRSRPIGDGWRHCQRCDRPIATEKELSVLEKALAQAGLPAEHLRLCPDCRDAAQGWTHRVIG